MEENKKDYVVLKTGYDNAVQDMLKVLENLENYEIIKDRILRKQRETLVGNQQYECFLYKYYDKENQLGYIMFDDIYELKGVVIFIEDGTYKQIDEKELLFAKHNEMIWNQRVTNKDDAEFKYNELISKFKEGVKMNELEKILNQKRTENGDIAYKTTGDNLTDIFFMTAFFEKNLDQVKIGESDKEKLFSMFVRDCRFGLGRRDLGRELMKQSGVKAENIVKAGRFDDLFNIPTDENINYLKKELYNGNELAKKWAPRLTGKNKRIAKALCKMWGISEKEYRKLIKTDSTTEYKLSYAEKKEETPLNELFGKNNYSHPLTDKIDFEKVPSLAMTKYTHLFSTREDFKERFLAYIQRVKENKAKVNVSTTNVYDAHKLVNKTRDISENNARDVIGKKIVDNATTGVEMDAIVILDTSGSMDWSNNIDKAYSIAHGLSTHSTYAKNQLISFSSRPQLMTIKGETLREQYQSMYTGDCSNTDFGKVMQLLAQLKKFPEYLIVISDMEFDCGSNQSKEETMKLFKSYEANTKIIWWNLDDRNKTVPEMDEYGNIYLSGYNLQILKLLENKFDMSTYIDKILEKYAKDIDFQKEI